MFRLGEYAAWPPELWPPNLKTPVRIMLTSQQPIWIGWGKELIYLYNDPYKSIIGSKHPWALGRPTAQVWTDIWDDIAPPSRDPSRACVQWSISYRTLTNEPQSAARMAPARTKWGCWQNRPP